MCGEVGQAPLEPPVDKRTVCLNLPRAQVRWRWSSVDRMTRFSIESFVYWLCTFCVCEGKNRKESYASMHYDLKKMLTSESVGICVSSFFCN